MTLPFTFTVEGVELHDASSSRRTAGSSSAATPRATATRPTTACRASRTRIRSWPPTGTTCGPSARNPLRHRRHEPESRRSSPTTTSTWSRSATAPTTSRFQVQLHERSNLITVRYRDRRARERASRDDRLPGRRRRVGDDRPAAHLQRQDSRRQPRRRGLVGRRRPRRPRDARRAHGSTAPTTSAGFTTPHRQRRTADGHAAVHVTIEGTSYIDARDLDQRLDRVRRQHVRQQRPDERLPAGARAHQPAPRRVLGRPEPVRHDHPLRHASGRRRTASFIADYEVDLNAGTRAATTCASRCRSTSARASINVRYRDKQSDANGQAATIGFQGAGGASATAYPLTCNGKILDDNRPDRRRLVDRIRRRSARCRCTACSRTAPTTSRGFATLDGDDASRTHAAVHVHDRRRRATAPSRSRRTAGSSSAATPRATATRPTTASRRRAHESVPRGLLGRHADRSSTDIRYGTVGTSRNRIFIADFYLENATATTATTTCTLQVQMHEGSNAITVKYRTAQAHARTARPRPSASRAPAARRATAHPLTCNGKILDDNRPARAGRSHRCRSAATASPRRAATRCATSAARTAARRRAAPRVCAFRAAGQSAARLGGRLRRRRELHRLERRPAPPTRTSSAGLPRRGGRLRRRPRPATASTTLSGGRLRVSATTCRASAGVCDVAETCTGSTALPGRRLPADAPPSCRAAAGVCDVAENCDGAAGRLPGRRQEPAPCCRRPAGVCDVAESCDGVGDRLPGRRRRAGDDRLPRRRAASATSPRAATASAPPARPTHSSTRPSSAAPPPASATSPRAATARARLSGRRLRAGDDRVPRRRRRLRRRRELHRLDAACPADAFEPGDRRVPRERRRLRRRRELHRRGADCPADAFEPASDGLPRRTPDADATSPSSCTRRAAGRLPGRRPCEPDGTPCNDGDVLHRSPTACVAGACAGDSMIVRRRHRAGQLRRGVRRRQHRRAATAARRPARSRSASAARLTPVTGCRRRSCPAKASVQLSNKVARRQGQLKWKWLKGDAHDARRLRRPARRPPATSSASTTRPDSGSRSRIPPGGTCAGKPCWKATGAKGFKYKDKELTPDGGSAAEAQGRRAREGADPVQGRAAQPRSCPTLAARCSRRRADAEQRRRLLGGRLQRARDEADRRAVQGGTTD